MLPRRRRLPRRRGKKRNKQKKKRTQIFLRPLCFFGGRFSGKNPRKSGKAPRGQGAALSFSVRLRSRSTMRRGKRAEKRESTQGSGGGVLFLRKAQEQVHHAAVAFHAVRLLIEL